MEWSVWTFVWKVLLTLHLLVFIWNHNWWAWNTAKTQTFNGSGGNIYCYRSPQKINMQTNMLFHEDLLIIQRHKTDYLKLQCQESARKLIIGQIFYLLELLREPSRHNTKLLLFCFNSQFFIYAEICFG